MTDTLQRATFQRGYAVDLQADRFQVSLIGSYRRKEWVYGSLAEAQAHYERLRAALRQSKEVSLDGVVEIDLLKFRHWLYTLPRGCVVGRYQHSAAIHPLMAWCMSRTQENYLFFGTFYAPVDGYKGDQHQYLFQPRTQLRLLPAEAQRYIERTFRSQRRRPVTREVALRDVEATLAEVERARQDFLATTRNGGKIETYDPSQQREVSPVPLSRRGYDVALNGLVVILIGKLFLKTIWHKDEEAAREHYHQIRQAIRRGIGLPPDGVPLLDPTVLRRYLRSLPRGGIFFEGKIRNPVAEYCYDLTGQSYLFWRDRQGNYWYATAYIPDPIPEEVTPEDFVFTMPPYLIPEPVTTFLSRLLHCKRTREQALEELHLAECIVQDMHAMVRAFTQRGVPTRVLNASHRSITDFPGEDDFDVDEDA